MLNVRAAAEHLGDDGPVELARESGHGQREEHLATHRVDVRHGVRGGDRPPGVRVVDHGREEVDRLHDRDIVRDPEHRRVVGPAQPDEEVTRRLRGDAVPPLESEQHLLEVSRSHLGGSPRAGGVRGETDLLAAGVRVGHRADDAPGPDWDATKSRKAWASGERLRSRWVTRKNARPNASPSTLTQCSQPA